MLARTVGLQRLFARYDDDGSGSLDIGEFFHVIRTDLGVSAEA
eukprot:COSAG02_NODE_44664_length_364_cov_0.762264_1_plen_42_part_10